MAVATLYNRLIDVEEASDKFTNRPEVFSELAPLLAAYNYIYGICLVHAHCKLEEGEAMVADGLVSKPERAGPYYPERWLATGEPYEFNRLPTVTPPAELFEQFRRVVGDLNHVLGLYFAGNMPSSGVLLERTEGRANIVTLTDREVPEHLATCWLPGKGPRPITMICHWECVKEQGTHVGKHDS